MRGFERFDEVGYYGICEYMSTFLQVLPSNLDVLSINGTHGVLLYVLNTTAFMIQIDPYPYRFITVALKRFIDYTVKFIFSIEAKEVLLTLG